LIPRIAAFCEQISLRCDILVPAGHCSPSFASGDKYIRGWRCD
jgi:hypothetical protein